MTTCCILTSCCRALLERERQQVFWNIHPMGKLGDCHSSENGVEPGANVSWFKTHNATGLPDGHPNTSFRNFGIVIGIDRHQH